MTVNINIVIKLDLDGKVIVNEAEQPIGQQLLDEDFALSRSLGATGFPTIVLISEENKGIKIVGNRQFEQYVDALRQVLNMKELQPKEKPSLFNFIKKEKLLFSKEIEVMYDIEQSSVNSFIKKELSYNQYRINDILGELFITSIE